MIETGDGYRIRKLLYQIVPGFVATALLYEPESITERVLAVLNLTGHEPAGIAVEYEQKRCINFAKRGIVGLNSVGLNSEWGARSVKNSIRSPVGTWKLKRYTQ